MWCVLRLFLIDVPSTREGARQSIVWIMTTRRANIHLCASMLATKTTKSLSPTIPCPLASLQGTSGKSAEFLDQEAGEPVVHNTRRAHDRSAKATELLDQEPDESVLGAISFAAIL